MSTTTNTAEMNKNELRAACKEVGIKYGKLDNAGMRAALDAHYEAVAAEEAKQAEAEAQAEAEVEQAPAPACNMFAQLDPSFRAPTSASPKTKPVESQPRTPRSERTPAPILPPTIRKGYTIQKEREERNGVKRPSNGTTCGAVWALFDEMHAAGNGPVAADLISIADENCWNRTNVSCEFYAWRKFMGIKGRQAK